MMVIAVSTLKAPLRDVSTTHLSFRKLNALMRAALGK
jgi:hypothetical protein